MDIGDRVKFKTMGGWYNSGIIKDMDEDSYLIEVDKLGYKPPENACISLPYHVRVLSCEIAEQEKEDIAMIDGMRNTAYVCGYRGEDVEYAVHQALKRMRRYDLLPPCERK